MSISAEEDLKYGTFNNVGGSDKETLIPRSLKARKKYDFYPVYGDV